MWTSFGSFLITPCRNRNSPKLMEIYQFKPLSLWWWCFMPILLFC
jgi:hypothetical protein